MAPTKILVALCLLLGLLGTASEAKRINQFEL
jgi:hypothetical protein